MARSTVRHLDPGTTARGRAAPAEEPRPAPNDLAEAIRRRFAPLGGVELGPAPRAPEREPPRFEG